MHHSFTYHYGMAGIYDEAEDSYQVQTRLIAGATDPTSDICLL
jgi:hypothetical protein